MKHSENASTDRMRLGSPGRSTQEIFGGFTADGEQVPTGPHLLVSGPTGSGKTRRVLAPATLCWDGPVVNISSKADMFDLCAKDRLALPRKTGTNKAYLLDMTYSVADSDIPEGVSRIWLNPCLFCKTPGEAIDYAGRLVRATGGQETGEGAFWESLGISFVAPLLVAAGEDGPSWILKAVNWFSDEIPVGDVEEGRFVLNSLHTAIMGGNDVAVSGLAKPSIGLAYKRLLDNGDFELADSLKSAVGKTEGQFQSVRLYVDKALKPWVDYRSQIGIPFDPSMLCDPGATLYIVAGLDSGAQGAVVLCLESILDRWRRGQLADVKPPRLLMVIDELCNTAPWTRLPAVVTEARSIGLAVLGAVQITNQFARVFGSSALDEMRGVWPAFLCLAGAEEEWKWDRKQREYDLRRKFNQPVKKLSPPPDTPDEGVLFYTTFPSSGYSRVSEYSSGVPVVLKDVSMIDITTELEPYTSPDSDDLSGRASSGVSMIDESSEQGGVIDHEHVADQLDVPGRIDDDTKEEGVLEMSGDTSNRPGGTSTTESDVVDELESDIETSGELTAEDTREADRLRKKYLKVVDWDKLVDNDRVSRIIDNWTALESKKKR